MPVRNVNGVHAGKPIPDLFDCSVIIDHENAVLCSVGTVKGNRRLPGAHPGREGRQCFVSAIAQKDRPGLRVAHIHVPDAVLLLFLPRILVLFDDAVLIIVNGGHGDNAALRAPPEGLFIQVITGLFLLHKVPRVDALPQKIMRLLVHLWRIHVGIRRKLRLRPVDFQETALMRFGVRACLFPAEHVIGKAGDLLCQFFGGTVRPERSDICHMSFSPVLCLVPHDTHADDTLHLLQLFDQRVGDVVFQINQGVGIFALGLVGQIGDVEL